MKIIKNIIVAFSLYSQIPMPVFEWKEEDMKHNIVFLPLIGAVIGIVSFGLFLLFQYVQLPQICRIAIYSLVPLLITGGFHIDGYMDVQDALKSYKSKQEKLEILKDPHVGAFAVIRIMIYSLAWIGAMSIIVDKNIDKYLYSYFWIFFMVRSISTISILKCRHAKKDGMLNMETQKSENIDLILCVVQVLAGISICLWFDYKMALALVCVTLLHFWYYKNLCYRQFGGVTGDTTGFYITTLEEWLLVMIAVFSLL